MLLNERDRGGAKSTLAGRGVRFVSDVFGLQSAVRCAHVVALDLTVRRARVSVLHRGADLVVMRRHAVQYGAEGGGNRRLD